MGIGNYLNTIFKQGVIDSLTRTEVMALAEKKLGDLTGKVKNTSTLLRKAEIEEWVRAINAYQGERPSRLLMLPLFKRAMMDTQVWSTTDTRTAAILKSKYSIKKLGSNEENEELIGLFESQWFRDFLVIAMQAVYTGHKLIEIHSLNEEGRIAKVKQVPDAHVNPWKGIVTVNRGDEQGFEFRKGRFADYYIEVGNPDDMGILSILIPAVIIKGLGQRFWADYAQKLGVPPRVLKRRGSSKPRLKELEDMMENMVSSNWAIIDAEETLELFESKGGGAPHELFDRLMSRMESGIAKVVLGQDGTTDHKDGGGTYGSLMVLKGIADARHAMDKQSLYYLINDQLLPRLIKLGYPLTGYYFDWDDFQELSAKEVIDAVRDLSQSYEFDIDLLAQRTGLPITGLRRLPGEVVQGGAQGLGKQ